jgi:hypothetical protein
MALHGHHNDSNPPTSSLPENPLTATVRLASLIALIAFQFFCVKFPKIWERDDVYRLRLSCWLSELLRALGRVGLRIEHSSKGRESK